MRAAWSGESTPATSPALNRDPGRETRATGRAIRLRGLAALSALLQFYYKAKLQKYFNFQLFKTAEKRGLVDFICTNNQAICCSNNHRLTQSAKNIKRNGIVITYIMK